jgi:DeoR/GlpR family transcriptional regulator of sugar metabolism
MSGFGRITTHRRQRLLNQLERGAARVADLAEAFGVSEITVRRDLDELVEEGLVERFHGGARLTQHPLPETLFADKPRLHAQEKETIGAVAAGLVADEDTLFLNAGSTTLSVLRNLARRRVRVVTNNAAAPSEINDDPNLELILVGGLYRSKSNSLYGDLAAMSLSQIHASICVLGTNGVSAKTGLTSSVYGETVINRLMVERCQGRIIVVADGSKIGHTSSFACVPLANVSTLVTDASANPDELAAIRAQGVDVIVCDADDSGEATSD